MKKTFTLMLLVLATLGTNAQVEWTIWEGTIAMGDWGQLYTSGEVFKPLEAGDAIKCYITYSEGSYHEIYIQYTYGSETTLKEQKDLTSDVTSVSHTLTDADISNLSQGNIKIAGKGFTLNKLAVVKNKSVIKHTISETSKTYDGGENYITYIEDENNHDYLKSGDYVLVTRETCATDNDDEIQICAKDKNSGSNWTSGTTIHSKGNFLGTIESSLNMSSSRLFIIQGKSFNFTGAYAYHPVPSFSIGSIGMATFSADVAVSVPDGIEAYYATLNGAKTAITLTKIEDGIIPANTGVIIKGTEGTVVEFTATTTENSVTSALSANVSATTMTDGDYVLYNNGGTAEFRKVTATQLAANKAFLPASNIAGAPSLSISIDGMGNTTGISNVQKTAVEDNRIYNLNGQEVKNAGKGIFIKNGKKYIIK